MSSKPDETDPLEASLHDEDKEEDTQPGDGVEVSSEPKPDDSSLHDEQKEEGTKSCDGVEASSEPKPDDPSLHDEQKEEGTKSCDGVEASSEPKPDDSSLRDEEKAYDTKSGDDAEASSGPQLEPDAKRFDESDVESTASPLNVEPNLQTAQPSEPKEDKNDAPIVASNVEQKEEPNQDDPSGDGPKIFQRRRSIDNNAVSEDKFQQSARDCGGAEVDTNESDAKEVVPSAKTTPAPVEGIGVSAENQSDTRSSESGSTGGQDAVERGELPAENQSEAGSSTSGSTGYQDAVEGGELSVDNQSDAGSSKSGSTGRQNKAEDNLSADNEFDAGSSKSGSADGQNEVGGAVSTGNESDAGSSKSGSTGARFEVSADNKSDTQSNESGSTGGQDTKASSPETEENDQFQQEPIRQDSEIEDTLHSREDLQPGQDDAGSRESSESEKDKEGTAPMGEARNSPECAPRDESAGLNLLPSEPISPTRATHSLHADIDSMREVPSNFDDFENVESPARELQVRNSTDGTPNADNRKGASERELEASENNLFKDDEVDNESSSRSSESTNQSNGQSDSKEEQKLKAANIGNTDQYQPENSEHQDEHDSISSDQSSLIENNTEQDGVLEIRSKGLSSEDAPGVPSTNVSSPVSNNNNLKLEDLEALQQFNPSSSKSPATSPIEESPKQELKRLEDVLLGSTPSVVLSNATSEDPSSSEDDENLIDSGRNPELQHLEDLMRGSTPYTNRSNSTLNDSILNEMNETQADTETSSSRQHSTTQSTLSEKMIPPNDLLELEAHTSTPSNRSTPSSRSGDQAVSMQKSKLDILSPMQDPKFDTPEPELDSELAFLLPTPNSKLDLPAPMFDSELDIPNTIRSTENIEAPTPIGHQDKEFREEGLSVFSDATSGQDFLRSVSNARKRLEEIDNEMKKLKGVSDNGDAGTMDNINSNFTDTASEIPPFDTNRSVKSNQSEAVPKEEKSPKQSERRMEPPTQSKKEGSQRSSSKRTSSKRTSSKRSASKRSASKRSSDERKKKDRRKTSKKKQVRPETGDEKAPMDPDGKVMPRTRYNKRGMERDTSSPMDVGDSEQNRYNNDPPMVIGGYLEAEESPPIEENLEAEESPPPIEKKKERKKKKKKKQRNRADEPPKSEEPFEDEVVMNMGSVVSSRMDRGDEGWSVPVDEIDVGNEGESNGVPSHVETKKSNDRQEQYDPWEEVPCSWCCRYLPHTLVVATTQAYRLDRADEKENELFDSKH